MAAGAAHAACPCRYAARLPASIGASPAARNAPHAPESTSPLPAVASFADVVRLTRAAPSGATTSVRLPLSNTVTPRSAAVARTTPSRSAASSCAPTPVSRWNSPAWGVSRVGARRPRTSPRSRDRMVSASASTSTGRSVPSTAATSRAAPSSVPMPGPTTQAWTCPAASRAAPSPGSITVMTTSGWALRTISAGWAAETNRTIPAPARAALPVDSTAAPVYAGLPATTPTTPRVYLESSGPGEGSRRAASAASSAVRSGAPRWGLIPMSISSTCPVWNAPGAMSSPRLYAPKVTVTAARTAAPATAPVSESTPLGTSTATVHSCGARRASRAAGSRNAPRPPMPTSPSRTRSAAPSSSGSPSPPASQRLPPARCRAVHPPAWMSPAARTSTRAPRRASQAPA